MRKIILLNISKNIRGGDDNTIASRDMKWTIPFVWDVLSSNSLAYFDMRSSPTEGRQSVAVSLDLGSCAFGVGTSSVHPTNIGVEPVIPLPTGADISSTVPNSQVNMSYGSGGFVAQMGY